MKYTEWRDELYNNLLCFSENERRRVLDYYAEAYADRREAGFSEREIISEFGAPYDAAQRILSEGAGFDRGNPQRRQAPPPPPPRPQPVRSDRRDAGDYPPPPPPRYNRREANDYPPPPPPQPEQTTDNTWIFVLLCIIFCVPLFGLIMTMVGITIGFCTAPIAVIGSGAAIMGSGIGSMATGNFGYGLATFASGLIALGIGIILCPLFFKLVKIMWMLFGKVFNRLKSLFSGKTGKGAYVNERRY